MLDSERRKRTSRSGALAQILAEEAEIKTFPSEQTAIQNQLVPSKPEVPVTRYFPTKGRAKVSPHSCCLWRYADRPETEALHATELAKSLVEDGQIAAVIVRHINDPQRPAIHYEIICGQVRWRAALEAGADLEIDIRDLDDKAAFRLMVRENELRRGLSDYATAIRLKRAIEEELYPDRGTLAADMKLSATQLSYYLGFAALPQEVIGKIKDITKITVRLGYAIHRAIEEGFLNQVLNDLEAIEKGAISRDQIPAIWTNRQGSASTVQSISVSRKPPQARRFLGQNGTPLFSLREDGESGPVLRFSKAVGHVLDEDFWKEIEAKIEARLQQDFSVEK
jgi:ParB/RepB/Spo0J family partition protein